MRWLRAFKQCRRLGEELDSRAAPAIAELAALGPSVGWLVKCWLRWGSARARRRAAETLGRMHDKRATGALISSLKDSDSLVRINAAQALGEIGDPQAVEPLIRAVTDDHIVLFACASLGEIKTPRALEALSATLDGNSIVPYQALQRRIAAANGLLIAGDPRGRNAIVELFLYHPDPHTRERMRVILKRVNWEPRTPAEQLAELLNTAGYSHEYEKVAKAGPELVEPLIQWLNHGDPYLRGQALSALASLKDSRAVPALIRILADELRGAGAAAALAAIGDPRAVEPLAAALHCPRWDVAESAALALSRFKASQFVPEIITLLERYNQNCPPPYNSISSSGPSGFVQALANFADPRAIPVLEATLLLWRTDHGLQSSLGQILSDLKAPKHKRI